MALPIHILMVYGYLLLFVWVLVEQVGIPLPATPVILAAGALSAEHQISFWLALLAGVAGSLAADSGWFLVGRRYGHVVLRILCKLSMEPSRNHVDDREVCAGLVDACAAGCRPKRHGLWSVPAL
jgi:membrane protein DedA with SNARE-associated domain